MIRFKLPPTIFSLYYAVLQTATAIFLRFLGYPLHLLIKREKKLFLVISRPGSKFSDNSKYFFVYFTKFRQYGERIVLLTTDNDTYRKVKNLGGEAVLHPTFQSLLLLLKCEIAVADFDWFRFGAFPLLRGSILVQLWHGAPLKHIELDLLKKRLQKMPIWMQKILKLQKHIIGRYPHYDIVVSTSNWFIDEIFQYCFNSKQYLATGYPRNDILYGWPEQDEIAYRLAKINVDMKTLATIDSAKKNGFSIFLYVPTFRQKMESPFDKFIDLSRLSDLSKKNNFLFVLKLHPFMHRYYKIGDYPNLIEYSSVADVYPVMPYCDLLITDYSSIFFDFLLLDRPIIFFPYDLEEYISNDRSIYFDYDSITPGPKCKTYDDLELQLKKIIVDTDRDEYSGMRRKIRTLTHDHTNNQSSLRLYKSLKKIL